MIGRRGTCWRIVAIQTGPVLRLVQSWIVATGSVLLEVKHLTLELHDKGDRHYGNR